MLTFGNIASVLNVSHDFLNHFSYMEGVNGCLRSVIINAGMMNLQTGYLDDFPVQPGCPREEYCIPDPCDNDGLCIASWNGYTCQCGVDYEGHNCTEGNEFA